jgi:5-methylcytosine-specific restriction endonuclease McrA
LKPRLDVHHRIRVRCFQTPEEAHTPDNMITLCRSCHRSVDVGSIPCPPIPG